jgi:Flp pilus assembly protein TadG
MRPVRARRGRLGRLTGGGTSTGAGDERGLITTELAVLMFPFIVGCVALVTFAGRISQAEGDVQSAAQEAARAATLTGDAGQAASVARSVAVSNLADSRVACAGGIDVDVATAGFAPGDYVTVTVTCTARFSDVAYLRVPGSRDFRYTATEIIDVYRSSTP